MSNDFELSRRKALAALGSIGVASAGAGLGTSAYFSDTETFENNRLVAGELDLKMDWEEHYSDWSTDESEGLSRDPTMEDPEDPSFVGLPDPNAPELWVHESDIETFMANTTIEAFPDSSTDDTPRATFVETNSGGEPIVNNPCTTLADVPQDLGTYNQEVDGSNTTLQDPGRTLNEDTYDADNDEVLPLINLTDVKPGDFGEVTFSTHLCDNPGYLWLQMPGGLTASENGVTEAEADDPDEDQVEGDGNPDLKDSDDSDGKTVELVDKIKTTLWYDDNCNNRIDGEPEDLVALAVIDTSASNLTQIQDIVDAANRFVERLNTITQNNSSLGIQAGVITFEDTGDTNNPVVIEEIVPVSNYVDANGDGRFGTGDFLPTAGGLGGNSPIPQALDTGREYLNDVAADLDADTTNNIEDPNKEILLLSDGAPVYDTGTTGELIEPGGSTFMYNGSDYESDYFDGLVDGDPVTLPDPDSSGSLIGTSRAETALVARDIDGEPFLPGTSASQPAGPKTDDSDFLPVNGDSDADISGENDITIRSVATYLDDTDPTTSPSPELARDTMLSYATDVGTFYDITMGGPVTVADNIVSDLNVATGEQIIFDEISLRELEQRLDPDQGGPLRLDGNRADPEDECFSPGATHCFALAWWLPLNHGNEVQSDSVSFDLGFYTEQCRHNDGSGMNSEEV
jgi:predicted ribosomally synthesized peptide with SipW-like signal peptide